MCDWYDVNVFLPSYFVVKNVDIVRCSINKTGKKVEIYCPIVTYFFCGTVGWVFTLPSRLQ